MNESLRKLVESDAIVHRAHEWNPGPLVLGSHGRTGLARLFCGSVSHKVVAERLRASGLEVSSSIQSDDPRQLVVREAESWGADCVFLGATGELTLERFLFETVVAAVTARAHCSVEIVR